MCSCEINKITKYYTANKITVKHCLRGVLQTSMPLTYLFPSKGQHGGYAGMKGATTH